MGKRLILSRLNLSIDYTLQIYHCHFHKVVKIKTKKCNLSKILGKYTSGYMHYFLPRKTTLYHLVTIISWKWSITSCQFCSQSLCRWDPSPVYPTVPRRNLHDLFMNMGPTRAKSKGFELKVIIVIDSHHPLNLV